MRQSIGKSIIEFGRNSGRELKANDSIHDLITAYAEATNKDREDVIKQMQSEVEQRFGELLYTMAIDWRNDHNSEGTPSRYAKMVLHETLTGRYNPPPKITDFPNVSNADQLIVVKRLRVESLCSHHHQNIRGFCHIGVLPDPEGNVIGLSKYSRIVDWFSRRPQIQEELTVNIANYIQDMIQPQGVAVVIEAEHQCMSIRGVQESSSVTQTAHLLGAFMESRDLTNEFYSAIARSTL